MNEKILIADDQADVLEALRLLLKKEGFQIATANSPAKILAALEAEAFALVLMDLNYTRDTTSGREGLELLPKIRAIAPEMPIVVMTAWATIDSAVEAMKHGARDFVEKPWNNARLVSTVKTQLELGRALARVRHLEDESARQRKSGLSELIAGAKSMAPIKRLIERVAPSTAPVLITGEHGTGKEVVARVIHEASSRAAKPFVAINSGGLAEGIFESELFGHVRGAFTDAKTDRAGCFEAAEGGTLFLDELGNMPLAQQAKLLRVLQTGEIQRVGSSRVIKVDVRILVATNVDLPKEAAAGKFREDLYYRLNTVEIHLPPLRERGEDIPLLAKHFLEKVAARYGRKAPELDPAAMQALLEYPWPGNVRELEHVMERAMLLQDGASIRPEDLALRGRAAPKSTGPSALESMTLDDAEKYLIEKALERAKGNVSEAADSLGLSRSALYRRLQRFGLGAGGE